MATLPGLVTTKEAVSFKHVVVGTDFSETSERAVNFALAFAGRYNSELCVVHALKPEPREPIAIEPLPRELNRQRLEAERQIDSLENDPTMKALSHKVLLRSGKVSNVLTAIAQIEDADLLILGTHGRGHLKKMALGSVAEEMVRQAACPVITIGPKVVVPETVDWRLILFATDFGPGSSKALPYAVSLARDSGAKLVLLHMVPPVTPMQAGFVPAVFGAEDVFEWQSTMQKESEKRLSSLIPAGTLAREPEFIVGLDFLPEGILTVAAEHNADLIVMGASDSSSPRLAAHLPWAVIHDVICGSKCPVMTVRE